MSVALSELVPTLRRTLNPPGQVLVTAGNSEWVGRLADAFWDARLQDFFVGYTVNSTTNTIEPTAAGGADLTRDEQTLIVRYAAIRAIHTMLLNMATMTRAKAGPVETETQRSANLLVAILKDISGELEEIKLRMRNDLAGRQIAFLDSMAIANSRVIEGYYNGWGGGFGFVGS